MNDIHQLNFLQLEELVVTVIEGNEELFREVLQKFNKIRHLGLYLNTNNDISIYNAFRELPVLPDLIDINIWPRGRPRSVFILNCLKQIAKKWPNLKRIELFNIVLEHISDFEQLMSLLKAFPHLKRLDISLEPNSGLEFDKIFSFENFPQELTHLTLNFNGKALNVFHLRDIDIYLPKLQYLHIRSKIITNEVGVTYMAGILCRLSFLQTIKLWSNCGLISELMNAKITKNCRKIRKIDVIGMKF